MKNHIEGAPSESNFKLKAESLNLRVEPGSNDVIVKNLYVSIDLYQLNRLKSYSSSQEAVSAAARITPGEAIDANGVAKVVVSANPEFKRDDLVVGLISWGEYELVKGGAMIRRLEPMGFPLSYHVGILAQKGEKVFVSGAYGHLVGQYAKLGGCYVVGSAGTNEKVAILKEKLGFDDAFNYKEETDLKATLKRYFPDGIDVYFDNVGGEMLEAAVANMNLFGRVAACGVISECADDSKRAVPNMIDIVYKRIKIQGFLSTDHFDLHQDFISMTCDALRAGKIQPLEDISNGVDSIPSAFTGFFRGDNIGKKFVRIAGE
ncbi:PKS ER domain-containing protein [Citrus sinensis]|uniref:PKS ER domain-containing protein n=1 Tax=Citrus sinensis TaxID=2711 RepID=A0ACB8NQ49_CITSI|nr:PKS ER domain-containing protein [Citrus sinensis]